MAISLTCTNHPHSGTITVQTSPTTEYSNVDKIRIKRKPTNLGNQSEAFTAVYLTSILSDDDFNITFEDGLCRNNVEYLYMVEYLRDTSATNYSVVASKTFTIKSVFDVMLLWDESGYWKTPLNVAPINFNTIAPYSINTPVNAKKPSTYMLSQQNYDEGTAKGVWLKMVGPEDKITFETDHNWYYRQQFKSFLTNGKLKILKSVSGEMWAVGIKTDTIADASLFDTAEIDGARQIEFSWFEVGDVNSEEDLYELGFINVLEKYRCGS